MVVGLACVSAEPASLPRPRRSLFSGLPFTHHQRFRFARKVSNLAKVMPNSENTNGTLQISTEQPVVMHDCIKYRTMQYLLFATLIAVRLLQLPGVAGFPLGFKNLQK